MNIRLLNMIRRTDPEIPEIVSDWYGNMKMNELQR